MHKSKAIISAVIIAAVAIFVVAAVSSYISGGSEHYQRPAPAVPTISESSPTDDTTEDNVQTSMTDEAAAILEDEKQALEGSMKEDLVDATAAVVDSATETAVETTDTLTDKTNEVIAAAEQTAADGRAEAEKMLEEVTQEAEKVVAPITEVVEATGKVHTVTAQGLIYDPLVVKIAPGDTVFWTNMSTHNTESLEGLIPEGAEMWSSKMSENYSHTFTQEGIYIYKCVPHFGAGMGGAIIVGEPVNLEQIKAVDAKGAAKRLVNKALQIAESM